MTVAELIVLLQAMPQDLLVDSESDCCNVYECWGHENDPPISKVEVCYQDTHEPGKDAIGRNRKIKTGTRPYMVLLS